MLGLTCIGDNIFYEIGGLGLDSDALIKMYALKDKAIAAEAAAGALATQAKLEGYRAKA